MNDLGGAQPDFSRGSTPSGVKNTVSSFLLIGLKYKDKNKLRQAIKTRVEKRLKQGAIEEIKSLLKKGYKKTDPGLKTIGYQQIISYLEGKVNKEEAIKQWITAEVQYAKRQLTFMKKDIPKANRELQIAIKYNPSVPEYLTGKKSIPKTFPELLTVGGENEAFVYASDFLKLWQRTPGAIEWLKEQTMEN